MAAAAGGVGGARTLEAEDDVVADVLTAADRQRVVDRLDDDVRAVHDVAEERVDDGAQRDGGIVVGLVVEEADAPRLAFAARQQVTN